MEVKEKKEKGSKYRLIHLRSGIPHELGKVPVNEARRVARQFGKTNVRLVRMTKSKGGVTVKF